MNLPNRLTLLRIVLIPVFVVFFSLNYVKAALVVFIIASVTDWADGFIARELVIGSFRTIAASKGIVIAAGISGKVKTVLQMIAAVLLMLGDFWIAKKIAAPVLWVAVAATAYSGLEYIYKNREILRSGN